MLSESSSSDMDRPDQTYLRKRIQPEVHGSEYLFGDPVSAGPQEEGLMNMVSSHSDQSGGEEEQNQAEGRDYLKGSKSNGGGGINREEQKEQVGDKGDEVERDREINSRILPQSDNQSYGKSSDKNDLEKEKEEILNKKDKQCDISVNISQKMGQGPKKQIPFEEEHQQINLIDKDSNPNKEVIKKVIPFKGYGVMIGGDSEKEGQEKLQRQKKDSLLDKAFVKDEDCEELVLGKEEQVMPKKLGQQQAEKVNVKSQEPPLLQQKEQKGEDFVEQKPIKALKQGQGNQISCQTLKILKHQIVTQVVQTIRSQLYKQHIQRQRFFEDISRCLQKSIKTTVQQQMSQQKRQSRNQLSSMKNIMLKVIQVVQRSDRRWLSLQNKLQTLSKK